MDSEILSSEAYIDKFITEFHGIEGVTINDKTINLFQLFHRSSILHTNEPVLNALVTKLQPNTYLENIFYVKFLIFFHRQKELFDEFVKGNHMVINRVRKHRWIFATDATKCIPQILSSISYNVRMKLLKKLIPAFNEQQADITFDILLQMYGLPTASIIIASCNVNKIQHILKNYRLKLWPNQLKLLYDKDPHLIYIYLEQHEKETLDKNIGEYKSLFKYIAGKDLHMFHDLCQKYNIQVILGKRMTKKIVSAKKREIMACPELYIKHLHPASLIKALGPDFKSVYRKLFPRKVEDSPNAETSRLLKYYPKRNRYNLMVTTFNEIFAKKLDQSPHLIDEYILQMISDPDERERLAKIKANNDVDSYLKYYRPDHCFKIIQDRINFARLPYERGKLVQILVEACLVNNDFSALLETAKFVTERFKNDAYEVQHNFLQSLIWHKCDFGKLNENHWKEITKIITRDDCYSDYTVTEIFYKYVEFRIKSGESVVDPLRNFFKQRVFTVDLTHIQSQLAQKVLLHSLMEVVPQLHATDSVEQLDIKVLTSCHEYNMKHYKNRVNVHQYPRLLQSMKNILLGKVSVEENTISSALSVLICTNETFAEVEEVRRLLSNDFHWATPFIIKWFLKHRPEFIGENLEVFLSFSIKSREISNDRKLWAMFKCYSHFGDRAIEFCSSNLTNQSCNILSYVMELQDYINLVDSLVSRTDTPHDAKKSLIMGLKNTRTGCLSVLLKYLQEDFMPSCLLSIFYKASLDEISKYFDVLLKWDNERVRMYIFHLISVISDNNTVLSFLHQFTPLQRVLISFNYFLKTQSDASWDLLKNELSNEEISEKIAFKLMTRKGVLLLSTSFKAQLFQNIWKILHRSDKCKALLKYVSPETFLALQPTFRQSVIDAELCISEEMDRLASTYLVKSMASDKLDIVCNVLQKYKTSTEYSGEKLNRFISIFFITCVEDVNLCENFLAKIQEIFPPNDIIEEEFITLTIAKMKNQDLKSVCMSVIQLHSTLIQKYGETITVIFAEVLRKILPHLYTTNMEMYKFYSVLLDNKTCPEDMLLVIKLLPTDSEPEDVESNKYYEHILSQLEHVNLNSIQLHLNLYFKLREVAHVSYYERVNHFCINTSSWLLPGARRKIGYYYF